MERQCKWCMASETVAKELDNAKTKTEYCVHEGGHEWVEI